MKQIVWPVAALTLLGVAGCATAPDCLDHRSYMDAKAFPALKSPPGLDVPQSDPAMQIPTVAAGPVGQFDAAPSGVDPEDPAARCLSTPPPMSG